MPGLRGRALYYPALLITGWVVGRSMIMSAELPARTVPEQRQAMAGVPLAHIQGGIVAPYCPILPSIGAEYEQYGGLQVRQNLAYVENRSRPWSHQQYSRTQSSQFALSDIAFNLADTPLPTSSARRTQASSVGQTSHAAARRRRLQLYGYSFWRQGSGAAALGPGAQYGGSQAGLIATWDPLGKAGKGPALLLRGAATPDGLEREIALGARWQPATRWPVSLSVERRFRFGAPDSFAAYAAGGVDEQPMFGKLRLNAYAQAGYDSGYGGTGFYDAQARLMHPLIQIAGIPVKIGAGSWAGGQRGVHRLDIGPTIGTKIENRFADLTFQLDWRKRVAGNAEPKDGLALTVSTGF
jgi:hypothetical protein